MSAFLQASLLHSRHSFGGIFIHCRIELKFTLGRTRHSLSRVPTAFGLAFSRVYGRDAASPDHLCRLQCCAACAYALIHIHSRFIPVIWILVCPFQCLNLRTQAFIFLFQSLIFLSPNFNLLSTFAFLDERRARQPFDRSSGLGRVDMSP